MQQEIKTTTDRSPGPRLDQSFTKLVNVASKPHEFFRDIQAIRSDHDLLVQASLVGQADLALDLLGALMETLLCDLNDFT